MRLGRETRGLHGERTGAGQRARHPLHGSLRQEQHQRRKGLLQSGSGYQEENH